MCFHLCFSIFLQDALHDAQKHNKHESTSPSIRVSGQWLTSCSVFSGESSEVYFLLKCVLSSQWLIKNKLERIPEVFTVKSLKPAVRARESEHLEEAFSLQELSNPCLRPDHRLSLCQGQEFSCWPRDLILPLPLQSPRHPPIDGAGGEPRNYQKEDKTVNHFPIPP